ncbi:hypothetical protein OAB88_06415, partial [Winogradskyella sp.]|nr:hypothetical protein [Winogradskyella sp.]
QINKKKNSVHFTFYIYIIIGFSLIISSTVFAELSLSKTYFWYYKFLIISAGITMLTNAYFKLNRFRKKLQNAEHRKNEIDLVLDKYRISYDSKLVLEEKIHGTQDIRVELKFKNWTKNQTATRYKVDC